MQEVNEKRPFISLAILQIIVAIGAIPAGFYFIMEPSGNILGMSTTWLAESPFATYLIPGIVLLLINGLGSLLGVILTFRDDPRSGLWAIGLGTFLMLWIVMQGIWLSNSSWLQPLFFLIGLVELFWGFKLHRSYHKKIEYPPFDTDATAMEVLQMKISTWLDNYLLGQSR